MHGERASRRQLRGASASGVVGCVASRRWRRGTARERAGTATRAAEWRAAEACQRSGVSRDQQLATNGRALPSNGLGCQRVGCTTWWPTRVRCTTCSTRIHRLWRRSPHASPIGITRRPRAPIAPTTRWAQRMPPRLTHTIRNQVATGASESAARSIPVVLTAKLYLLGSRRRTRCLPRRKVNEDVSKSWERFNATSRNSYMLDPILRYFHSQSKLTGALAACCTASRPGGASGPWLVARPWRWARPCALVRCVWHSLGTAPCLSAWSRTNEP